MKSAQSAINTAAHRRAMVTDRLPPAHRVASWALIILTFCAGITMADTALTTARNLPETLNAAAALRGM